MRGDFITLLLPCMLSAIFMDKVNAQSFDHRQLEQRRAEAHRKFEQHRAEFEKNFQRAQGHSSSSGVTTYGAAATSTYSSTNASARQNAYTASGRSASFSGNGTQVSTAAAGTNFNASSAPSPDKCFLSLVQTARSASRLDSLLSYLRESEVKSLKERQALYDPALAASRRAEYQKDHSMSADAIEHLTEDPFTGELKRLKRMANKVIKVRRSEIKGSKAELSVLTRSDAKARFNGGKWESFPYSSATVEMVGEGNYWHFVSYNDSSVSYKTPQ